MTTDLSPETRASFDLMYAKRVRSFVRRANKWFAWCDRYQEVGPQRAGKRPVNPSKDAKHQAYSDAAQLCRLRGIAERPHTFAGLCALVGEPCALTERSSPRRDDER